MLVSCDAFVFQDLIAWLHLCYITCDLSFHPIPHYSAIEIPVMRHGKTIYFVRSFLYFIVLAGILKQDTCIQPEAFTFPYAILKGLTYLWVVLS